MNWHSWPRRSCWSSASKKVAFSSPSGDSNRMEAEALGAISLLGDEGGISMVLSCSLLALFWVNDISSDGGDEDLHLFPTGVNGEWKPRTYLAHCFGTRLGSPGGCLGCFLLVFWGIFTSGIKQDLVRVEDSSLWRMGSRGPSWCPNFLYSWMGH